LSVAAADDLGASPWQRFWQIELPILRPGIVNAGIFGFLLSFTELPRSIYLRGVTTTLPLFEWAHAASQTSEHSLPRRPQHSDILGKPAAHRSGRLASFRRAEG
jgi:ABC-type molybdate transport system permease subunit